MQPHLLWLCFSLFVAPFGSSSLRDSAELVRRVRSFFLLWATVCLGGHYVEISIEIGDHCMRLCLRVRCDARVFKITRNLPCLMTPLLLSCGDFQYRSTLDKYRSPSVTTAFEDQSAVATEQSSPLVSSLDEYFCVLSQSNS